MVIGVFAMISVNLVDTYFVGLLGTEELAAMSFTFPVVGLIINLCMGIGIGVTATIARLVGADARVEAEQVAGHALLIALLISGSLALLGFLTHDLIFTALGAEGQLLVYLNEYMRWWFIGLPFLVIVIVSNGVLRAHGNSKAPMRLMLLVAGVNVLLDPILIFGLWGAPALRLEGAAIATMIARIITFTFAMRLVFKQGFIPLSSLTPRGLWRSWQTIARIGLPAAMTNALGPFSAGLITALIALHGESVIAGYGLAIRFEGLFLIVPMVMGGALSPFVGQNWGAHLNHRVIEGLTFARRISIIWGLAVWGLVELSAPALARTLSTDLAVQDAFVIYLRICSASYLFQGMIYSANATFNAINRPLKATLVSTMNSLLIALPCAYLGHHSFGYPGIIAGLLCARIVSGVVADRWIWKLFSDDDKAVALSDVAVKAKLYQLEQALPALALDLEHLVLRLGHIPALEVSAGEKGGLTYLIGGREIAHLDLNGTCDVRLPPQLRDAVVTEGWGTHHRREHDSCWVSHHLAEAKDIEEFIRLLCLAHAYRSCALEPSPQAEAKNEIAKLCEVTRTLEERAELKSLQLPTSIFQALLGAVRDARTAGLLPQELNHE